MSNNFEKFRLRRNNGTDIYPVYAIFSSDIIETFKNPIKHCNSIQISQTDVSNDFYLLIEDKDIVVKDKNIFLQKSLKFSYNDMKGKKCVIPLENVLIIQEEDRENFHR